MGGMHWHELGFNKSHMIARKVSEGDISCNTRYQMRLDCSKHFWPENFGEDLVKSKFNFFH